MRQSAHPLRTCQVTRKDGVVGAIVVGVDGSPESRSALQWAVEEARLRGASVRAIHVYDVPGVAWGAYAAPEGAAATTEQISELERSQLSSAAESQARAKALVEHAVAELGDTGGVNVDVAALHGRPAPKLIEESKDADLLVVGSRGRGGFAELLLGSVSHQCAQHAVCPVVILPNPGE
jgi:nucleotide-binding universal stress UspA family protein